MAQKKPEGLVAELGVEDLYEFLGVGPTSSKREVRRVVILEKGSCTLA